MKSKLFMVFVVTCLFLSACGTGQVNQVLTEPPDGEFRLKLNENRTIILTLSEGHFSTSSTDFGPMTEGRFSVDGNMIKFTEETVSEMAKAFCGSKYTYTYQWTYDHANSQLSFKADSDDCAARQDVFTSAAFAYSVQ